MSGRHTGRCRNKRRPVSTLPPLSTCRLTHHHGGGCRAGGEKRVLNVGRRARGTAPKRSGVPLWLNPEKDSPYYWTGLCAPGSLTAAGHKKPSVRVALSQQHRHASQLPQQPASTVSPPADSRQSPREQAFTHTHRRAAIICRNRGQIYYLDKKIPRCPVIAETRCVSYNVEMITLSTLLLFGVQKVILFTQRPLAPAVWINAVS